MIRSYIMWVLLVIIGLYIIKTAIEMFTSHNEPEEPEPEEDIPQELLDAYEAYPADTEHQIIDNKTNQPAYSHTEAPNPTAEFVKVYIAPTSAQAEIIILELQGKGIAAYTEDAGTSILPFGDQEMDSTAILVEEAEAQKAQEIIKQFMEQY